VRYSSHSRNALLNLTGFGICVALLGAAFYFEKVQGLDPCPLCMAQRVAVAITGFFFLLAFLHRPASVLWSRMYLLLLMLGGGLGVAVAGRHLWLQSLPADQVPLCGPSLEYMLEYFPLKEALLNLLHGSGSCAEVGWTFLGFSMPFWVMIWFFILMTIAWIGNYHLPRTRRDEFLE